MASLIKRGGRKPLAVGPIQTSYGMRCDVNDGRYGVQVIVATLEGPSYSLHLTNDEINAIVTMRDRFKPQDE